MFGLHLRMFTNDNYLNLFVPQTKPFILYQIHKYSVCMIVHEHAQSCASVHKHAGACTSMRERAQACFLQVFWTHAAAGSVWGKSCKPQWGLSDWLTSEHTCAVNKLNTISAPIQDEASWGPDPHSSFKAVQKDMTRTQALQSCKHSCSFRGSRSL